MAPCKAGFLCHDPQFGTDQQCELLTARTGRFHPVRDMATLSPEVSHWATIVLSAWMLHTLKKLLTTDTPECRIRPGLKELTLVVPLTRLWDKLSRSLPFYSWGCASKSPCGETWQLPDTPLQTCLQKKTLPLMLPGQLSDRPDLRSRCQWGLLNQKLALRKQLRKRTWQQNPTTPLPRDTDASA